MAILAATSAAVALAAPAASAESGCLDRTFADGGWSSAPSGYAAAAATGQDGSFFVAGTRDRYVAGPVPLWASDLVLAHYTADGSLDTAFGSGGSVVAATGGNERDRANGAAIAVQGDGRIVVAGSVQRFSGNTDPWEPSRVVLARYGSDGLPDSTFGSDGVVVSPFAAEATGVLVEPDGSIVVGGSSPTGASGAPQFFLARYDEHGVPDPGFGSAGSVAFGAGRGHAIARQASGHLVVAGQGAGNVFALARVDAGGVPDAAFGSGGVVTTDASIPPGYSSSAQAVVVQDDDRIVAGGFAAGRGFTLVRYGSDGILDGSFGDQGISSPVAGAASLSALVRDSDNRLVAAGGGYNGLNSFVAVARFSPEGVLDPSFGSGGLRTTEFDPSSDDRANAALTQADGSVVVAGSIASSSFLLAKFGSGTCDAVCQPPQCPAPLACAVEGTKNRILLQRKSGGDRLLWKTSRSTRSSSAATPDEGLAWDLQILDAAYGGRIVQHWPSSLVAAAAPRGFTFVVPSSGLEGKVRGGEAGRGSIGLAWKSGDRFLPLTPLVPPVTIRFFAPGLRECWSATFRSPAVRTNDSVTFDAR